jgi:ACDE family multidrug resistance protein
MIRDPHNDFSINAMALTIFTTNIGGGIIISILSIYIKHLNISLTMGGLAISLFAITRAISQPIVGHFIDRIDPRPVITTGIIIFTIASAAPAIPNATILFVARALLGIASGMVVVACYTIIARLYGDTHLRRMANARFMALEMIGSIVGPVLGSVTFWLSGSFSSPFIVCSMFGMIALAFFLKRVKDIGGDKPPQATEAEKKSRERMTFAPSGLPSLMLLSGLNFTLMFVWGGLLLIMPLFADSVGIAGYKAGYLFGTLSFGMILSIWLTQRKFLGDMPIEPLIIVGSIFALIPLTILVFVSHFWIWLLIFWAMGMGVGLLFPIFPSMASEAIISRPGQGVSYLEMGGNIGFILGPIMASFFVRGNDVSLPFYFEVAVSYVTVPGAIGLVLLRRRMARFKENPSEVPQT